MTLYLFSATVSGVFKYCICWHRVGMSIIKWMRASCIICHRHRGTLCCSLAIVVACHTNYGT